MFDHNFSFDTPRSPSIESSNASSTREPSRSVSPCSAVGPFPPPRYSVSDLAAQFADQRIQRKSQICYDSCETYANNDDDAGWQLPEDDVDMQPISRSRTFPQRSHSPSQRQQRQVNARLLCSSSHRQELAALVARMVQSKEQCSVHQIESIQAVAVEDEGYDSSEQSTPVHSRRSSIAVQKQQYRRSSDMKSTGASVRKDVRFRKDRHHSRKRSSEKS